MRSALGGFDKGLAFTARFAYNGSIKEQCAEMAVLRNMKQKNSLPMGIPVAVFVVFVICLVLLISGLQSQQRAEQATADGLAYLESLERMDPAQVDQVRKDIQKKKLEAQRDELLRQVTDGEVDPFSMFQDYVILGDSRAVGFWYFGFLEEDRCLTAGGDTIRNVEPNLEKILELNPATIYLCYGLNDTSIGYWDTKEEYVAEYMQILESLQEKLPDTKLVVSSILPARDPAFQLSSKWYNIPEWSAAVGEACEARGIAFADNDSISEQYPELWDPDGIHVRQAFYPYWATNLIVASLSGGIADES